MHRNIYNVFPFNAFLFICYDMLDERWNICVQLKSLFHSIHLHRCMARRHLYEHIYRFYATLCFINGLGICGWVSRMHVPMDSKWPFNTLTWRSSNAHVHRVRSDFFQSMLFRYVFFFFNMYFRFAMPRHRDHEGRASCDQNNNLRWMVNQISWIGKCLHINFFQSHSANNIPNSWNRNRRPKSNHSEYLLWRRGAKRAWWKKKSANIMNSVSQCFSVLNRT